MDETRKPWRAMLAVGILLACCSCAFALEPSLDISQYAHTAWKIRNGFSKGGILAIAQTPDGYIWLGTEFGLLHFDGVRNTLWQPPGGQRLPSDDVRCLLVARDGTLWIGTFKGLASWKGGKLIQYPELDGQFVSKLLEDREGAVWAGTVGSPGELCTIRVGTVRCEGEDSKFGYAIIDLYEDNRSNVWVGVVGGLWRWMPGPPKFYPLSGPADGARGLAEDTDGALLVGRNGGISRFGDSKTEAYLPQGAPHQFQVERTLRDRNGGLWIGTQTQGLLHVHQGKADQFLLSDGLSGADVYILFEDREGNIWVGTSDGLDRFRDIAITTITTKQGLSAALTGSVLPDMDGSIWLATYGGLDKWRSGQITTYDNRDGKLHGMIPDSLFQDRSGRVWVTTAREFGYLEGHQFIPMSGVPGGPVHGIIEDSEQNLWVANQDNGLFRLADGGVAQHIPWTGLGHKDHAGTLAADFSRGGIWLGFYEGGVAYFKDGRIRESYTIANGLGGGRVASLRSDPDGTLWAATQGGLSRIENGHVATMGSENGLPCNGVHWSIQDDDHSFWLYTPCGLLRIAGSEMSAWVTAVKNDKDAKPRIRFAVFDISDGVRSAANANSYTPQVGKSSDGKIWFITSDGVGVIDPRDLPSNKLPPPVHIEQVTADRKTYDASFDVNGDSSSHLRLAPHIRDLEIDYTALSFVAPEKVRFRYKLEGRDRDWQDVETRRQAYYSDLSPGNYRFRVRASNNDGVWNEAGTFLDFSIAPAYYQTTWFHVLCVAVFLGLLWALYQFRVRHLAREFDLGLEARVSERTRIARELHDTLLQSFHGLMFQFQAARNMLPRRPEEAIEVLDSAIGATEQAISDGRSAIQQLRSEQVDEGSLAQWLTTIGQELARSHNPNGDSAIFQITVEGEQQSLSSLPRNDICRIIREILQNAFRHARAKHIEAEIRYDDRLLRVRVRDDGTGIDPQVLQAGGSSGHWGLRGARERAQQIGARLDFWSEAGAGTEVQLTIPAAIAYERSRNKPRSRLFRKASTDAFRS